MSRHTFVDHGTGEVDRVCEIPDCIIGQYARAAEKFRRCSKNFQRLVYANGRQLRCRGVRQKRRATMWMHKELRWHERLQCIVPYLKDVRPASPSAREGRG